jgi:hypothetical protein
MHLGGSKLELFEEYEMSPMPGTFIIPLTLKEKRVYVRYTTNLSFWKLNGISIELLK